MKEETIKISNKLIHNNNLSSTEKWIMILLLSKSDDYIVYKKIIEEESGVGRDRFNKSWKHLMELGYIRNKRIQGGCHWFIYEEPDLNIF